MSQALCAWGMPGTPAERSSRASHGSRATVGRVWAAVACNPCWVQWHSSVGPPCSAGRAPPVPILLLAAAPVRRRLGRLRPDPCPAAGCPGGGREGSGCTHRPPVCRGAGAGGRWVGHCGLACGSVVAPDACWAGDLHFPAKRRAADWWSQPARPLAFLQVLYSPRPWVSGGEGCVGGGLGLARPDGSAGEAAQATPLPQASSLNTLPRLVSALSRRSRCIIHRRRSTGCTACPPRTWWRFISSTSATPSSEAASFSPFAEQVWHASLRLPERHRAWRMDVPLRIPPPTTPPFGAAPAAHTREALQLFPPAPRAAAAHPTSAPRSSLRAAYTTPACQILPKSVPVHPCPPDIPAFVAQPHTAAPVLP